MDRTAYSCYHEFVASSLITNTVDYNAFEGLYSIANFWHRSIVVESKAYIKKLNNEDLQDNGGEPNFQSVDVSIKVELTAYKTGNLLVHLPNLKVLTGVINLLSLFNLIKLSSVLDVRRYREEGGYKREEHYVVPPEVTALRERACVWMDELLGWLDVHVRLTYGGPDSDMGVGVKAMSRRYLCQQAKTLVYEKVQAEALGYEGEDKVITAKAVKRAIEKDLIEGDVEMQDLWPKTERVKVGGGKKNTEGTVGVDREGTISDDGEGDGDEGSSEDEGEGNVIEEGDDGDEMVGAGDSDGDGTVSDDEIEDREETASEWVKRWSGDKPQSYVWKEGEFCTWLG
ncbi:hypothetical protein EV361DRAFT_957166 [Lentinula raphanica]|nr:hypothetical protein EV361DRAFT_957166 [Lentinula raphanica]